MMLESLAVVQAQLGDSLSDYCTLQTDGTTKFGEHYATYDISTADGIYNILLGNASCFFRSCIRKLVSTVFIGYSEISAHCL